MVEKSYSQSKIQLGPNWPQELQEEFNKPYMISLRKFLKQELDLKKTIYPHGKDIFRAFHLTPFEQVKAVIIGQDPYHGPDQACGLCFSVSAHIPLPPSLKNIFKELENDLKVPFPSNGLLDHWAKEGVLLLNTVLTVEKGKAQSHGGKGWEIFTDEIIKTLNEKRKNLVFILWGSHAQKKGEVIDNKKHFIIKAPHPSPLSAHRGFFGGRYFSRTNEYLQKQNLPPIDWQLH